MLRRSFASSLVLALSLTLPLSAGCGKKQKLTEVKVPEAGVSLRYDLSPGQQYEGHVSVRNTVATPVGDVLTHLEFDVVLLVTANEDAGAKLVRAKLDKIVLDMRLPEGIPAAAVGGMSPETAAGLNGTELRFNLDEHGAVSNEPELPEGAPMEIKAIIGMLTGGLTSAFVRVPAQPVKDGGTWTDKPTKHKDGVKSAEYTGKLEGMGRNAAGDDIAQIEFGAEIEAEREGAKILVDQEGEASFSTTSGFPTTVKRKVNNEVVGQGSLLSEIEATWKKGGKQAALPAAPQPGEGEVQAITDPCDPDYVGGEECPADAAPAAPAPAAGTTPPK